MTYYEAFKKHCVNCSKGKKCYMPCYKFIKARFKKGDENICHVRDVVKELSDVILIVLIMLNLKQSWQKNTKHEGKKAV
nr:MAG TPA: hypothetical protein [Caudoviricetes sp.]